jgi:hypothetical protein
VSQGVCGLAIYIKNYIKAKRRRIMETQIFHRAKISSFQNPHIIKNRPMIIIIT